MNNLQKKHELSASWGLSKLFFGKVAKNSFRTMT